VPGRGSSERVAAHSFLRSLICLLACLLVEKEENLVTCEREHSVCVRAYHYGGSKGMYSNGHILASMD